MDAHTRRLVRARSGERCEYCRLPEHADEWSFHLDHIIARDHGGSDEADNLAWACSQCNWHKGTNFASIDPSTRRKTDLFNPRVDSWKDHFVLHETGEIEGFTPMGRATMRLLHFNDALRVELRRELLEQRNFHDQDARGS